MVTRAAGRLGILRGAEISPTKSFAAGSANGQELASPYCDPTEQCKRLWKSRHKLRFSCCSHGSDCRMAESKSGGLFGTDTTGRKENADPVLFRLIESVLYLTRRNALAIRECHA